MDRVAGLAIGRQRNRPLVVLAEEHDRCIEDGCEHEGLVHVALRRCPVAEVADRGVRGAVQTNAHRIADSVERLIADDDGARRAAIAVDVPAAIGHAAEHGEHLERGYPAHPGHAVLAVGREGEVGRRHRACRPDLRSLLTEAGGPEPELTLPLQGGRLKVEPADKGHVAKEAPEFFISEGDGEIRVINASALRRQELNSDRIDPRLIQRERPPCATSPWCCAERTCTPKPCAPTGPQGGTPV